MSLTSKNVSDIILTFDFVLFFSASVRDFQWLLWRSASGSNIKVHVSSPNKFDSICRRSMMSWHTCMRRSFWSSFSSLGTIFAQIFRIVKSSVIILQIVVVLKGQKWIIQRDVRFTAVYIYGNTDSNGYRILTRLAWLIYRVSHYS